MGIKIIAFDLDGTFLRDDKSIPPENLRALELAAARGVHIVPATGRIYRGIPETLRELPFLRWAITVNGAYVYDAAEDRAAARAEIPVARAVEFYEYADSLGLLYDCYQDNWGYMTAAMRETVLRIVPDPGIRRLIEDLRTPVPELKAWLAEKGADVQKLQLYFSDRGQRAELLRTLPARWPDLSFSTSLPFNIEINSRAATKGRALMALCALLGVEAKETLAFGDGTNDLDMLQSAGIGVAMANADEEVLQAADHITGSNNEGGVAAAVERFVLNPPEG